LMEIPRSTLYAPSELPWPEVARKATYQPMVTPLLDESCAKTEEAGRRVQHKGVDRCWHQTQELIVAIYDIGAFKKLSYHVNFGKDRSWSMDLPPSSRYLLCTSATASWQHTYLASLPSRHQGPFQCSHRYQLRHTLSTHKQTRIL